MTCDNCGIDTTTYATDSGAMCDECIDVSDLVQCDECDKWVTDVTQHDRMDYCPECFDALGLDQCQGCEQWFEASEIVIDDYCAECAGDNDYYVCSHCDEWRGCDGMICYDDELICDTCADAKGLTFCSGCDKYVDDGVECDNDYYCPSCANDKGYYECEVCNTWEQDTHQTDYSTYCNDCFYERFTYCDNCGGVFDLDECIPLENGTYCEDCAPNENEGDYDPQFKYMSKQDDYSMVGSPRRFGIELETHRCPNYMDLNRSGWGAKDDGSIRGKEFYSAVFNGNKGLKSVRSVCKYASKNAWEADHRCGYHLHLNMRDEDCDSLKAIAHAYTQTEAVWLSFVASHRDNTEYAHHIDYTPSSYNQCMTTEDWKRFCNYYGRYNWVNWKSYNNHGSLEIRLHEGTLDADRICNWLRAHATFVDWASKTGFKGVQVATYTNNHRDLLVQIWTEAGCEDLITYYSLEAVCV